MSFRPGTSYGRSEYKTQSNPYRLQRQRRRVDKEKMTVDGLSRTQTAECVEVTKLGGVCYI